jgi:type VI secretion system secreted protein VgrG
MGNLSQANTLGALKTPLGEDELVLKSFSGGEGLSELFGFYIEALSDAENNKPPKEFDHALGEPCTIRLKTYEGKERFFCGVLTQAQWVGRDQNYHNYKLVLRPWLWLLGNQAGCRIYLGKKVTDIIEDVFKKAGFDKGYQLDTKESYDEIEYCVQYRETDLAFVSRLMEQYGIYYFFEHKDGQHIMHLADGLSSHKPIEDLNEVRFNPAMMGYNRQQQNLLTWTSDRRFRTGKVEYNDYDFKSPSKQLLAFKDRSEGYNPARFEIYDYPGKYDDQGKGEKFARFHVEAEQALDFRRIADGDAPSLFAGGLVKVVDHPTDAENGEYYVVRAQHMFGTQYYAASDAARSAPAYTGSYELQPTEQHPSDHGRPFRSLPVTPKPRIYGIQTAKVVGKRNENNEEISTDKYGRIWVQFYWDKWEKSDPDQDRVRRSCPVRVAQKWASQQWGGQFIPRKGMEVVVEFLEGDPDQPLVTGCVYNDDNMPPYSLPDNKTQSGTKSDSSKGHGGYNEFMFEDLKGQEFIRMHAEKDHMVSINNDQTGSVGNDRTWTIEKGDDKMLLEKGDQSIVIDLGQQTVSAFQMITLKAGLGAMSSSIEITPCSITLKSPMIKLDASSPGGVIIINAPATVFPGGAVGIAKGPLAALGVVAPPPPA